MSRKITPEEYVQWLKDDGRGVVALEDYVTAGTKISHGCEVGHEWRATPNNIKRGKGCPHCAGKHPQPYNDWLESNRPEFTALEPYVNVDTPILHQCSEGHQWMSSPGNIKYAESGCPHCAGHVPQPYNEWLSENRPDFVALEPYINAKTKIKHRCPKGHEWMVAPTSFKGGKGCPHCSGWIPEDYKIWLKLNRPDLTLVEPYTGAGTPVVHRCAEGHEWAVKPNHIKGGSGCPTCANYNREYNSVYCWRVAGDRGDVVRALTGFHLVKFGVTSQHLGSQRIRICAHKNGMQADVIEQVNTKEGEGLPLEAQLLTLGEMPLIDPSIDGYTEFRLVSDEEVATIKKVMATAKEG